MKTPLKIFSLCLAPVLLASLMACDELVEDRLNKLEPREGQDVIHVGNGIHPEVLMALRERSGVVVDFQTPFGLSSHFFGSQGLVPLVVDVDSGKGLGVELGWVAAGEKQASVLELKFHEEKTCERYESLQNGRLVCRDDLDQLEFWEASKPAFALSGAIAYLDPDKSLRILQHGENRLVHHRVDEFFFDGHQRLIFRLEESPDWMLLRPLGSVDSSMTESLSRLVEGTRYVFTGSSGRLFVFEPEPLDAVRPALFEVLPDGTRELVATLPEGWHLVMDSQAFELSVREDRTNNLIVVERLDSVGSVVHSWVRMSGEGFELFEEDQGPGSESEPESGSHQMTSYSLAALDSEAPPAVPVQELVVQTELAQSLVKRRDTLSSPLTIEFCERVEEDLASAEASGVSSVVCRNLPLPESFFPSDALLADANEVLVAGHWWDEEANLHSGLLLLHRQLSEEGEESWETKHIRLDQPIERIRRLRDSD